MQRFNFVYAGFYTGVRACVRAYSATDVCFDAKQNNACVHTLTHIFLCGWFIPMKDEREMQVKHQGTDLHPSLILH